LRSAAIPHTSIISQARQKKNSFSCGYSRYSLSGYESFHPMQAFWKSYFSVRNFSQGNNQETCLEKELIILGSNGNGESCDEVWRILTHSSTALKSRAIRI
jgi:hypothetical protein